MHHPLRSNTDRRGGDYGLRSRVPAPSFTHEGESMRSIRCALGLHDWEGWKCLRCGRWDSSARLDAATDLIQMLEEARDNAGTMAVVEVGGEVLVGVHSDVLCRGEACPVHDPSDHHMRGWPAQQAPVGTLDRVCPHGYRHPDPDDATHRRNTDPLWDLDHDCDGCCFPPHLRLVSDG